MGQIVLTATAGGPLVSALVGRHPVRPRVLRARGGGVVTVAGAASEIGFDERDEVVVRLPRGEVERGVALAGDGAGEPLNPVVPAAFHVAERAVPLDGSRGRR